jgi:hypothetical protein
MLSDYFATIENDDRQGILAQPMPSPITAVAG